MNVYLNLTFATTEGKQFTMRVPDAVDSASAAPVKNSMDSLIEAGCIKTKYGDLSERLKASLVRVTSTGFDVTEI